MDLETLAQQAGDVTGPTPAQLDAGRRRLDDATRRAGARVVALCRSRAPRRRLATLMAGIAATAAVVVAVPLVGTPSASAEEVLLVTAEAAGQQPDLSAGAAYWYVRSEQYYPDEAAEPLVREIWLGRTEDGVLRDEALTWDDDGEGFAPEEIRNMSLDGPAAFNAGGTQFSWPDLEQLPTDPDELEALLKDRVAGHQSGEDNELWETVTGLLRESPAPPALRQALWEVAARMPDVELVGPMTDASGRDGTAIQRDQTDQGWYRVVYILDPETGALLETQNVDEDGDISYRQTELVQQPADTAPAADPPICGPGSVPERSC